jgi:two-component system, OmpR family, response regulator
MLAQERAPFVLVVDDDQGIRETVADFLEMEGYQVLQAGNVVEARRQLARQPDLMLLDLKMPGGDGLSFAGEIRAQSSIPIIIISGKGETIDRVVGLEVGADDYLPKPFELREMLSRIRALLRRVRVGAPAQGASDTETVARERSARFGGCLVLMPGRRQVVNQSGAVIDLTPQEFNLLAALVEHPRRIHGREAIASLLRRNDGAVDDRNIDALVSRLRRKLNGDVDAASLIQTVRGEGYVLASEVQWTEGAT